MILKALLALVILATLSPILILATFHELWPVAFPVAVYLGFMLSKNEEKLNEYRDSLQDRIQQHLAGRDGC